MHKLAFINSPYSDATIIAEKLRNNWCVMNGLPYDNVFLIDIDRALKMFMNSYGYDQDGTNEISLRCLRKDKTKSYQKRVILQELSYVDEMIKDNNIMKETLVIIYNITSLEAVEYLKSLNYTCLTLTNEQQLSNITKMYPSISENDVSELLHLDESLLKGETVNIQNEASIKKVVLNLLSMIIN